MSYVGSYHLIFSGVVSLVAFFLVSALLSFLEQRRRAKQQNSNTLPPVPTSPLLSEYQPHDSEVDGRGASGGSRVKTVGGNAHQRRIQRRRLARQIAAACLLLFACGWIRAQSGGASLTWTQSASQCTASCIVGQQGPTLVNIYRAAVTTGCTGATWSQIATGVAAGGPFSDLTVLAGQSYCYEVRAYFVQAGPTAESGGSNWAMYVAPKPAAPSGLTVHIQ